MINLKTLDWEIQNIDTILFDKDGTFVDLHYFWGKMTEMRAKAIVEHYHSSKENVKQICLFLGFDVNSRKMLKDGITALFSRQKIIEILIEKLLGINIQTNSKTLEEIFDNVSEKFYENFEKYTKPIDSAIEFIKKIKLMGIKTAIVTSDSDKSTMLTLKHFNWESLFDVVVARETTKHPKECGFPAKYALEKLNSKPENAIMIGDTPIDFICAKKAGIEKTILIATGQMEKEELLKSSPFSLSSLDELIVCNCI